MQNLKTGQFYGQTNQIIQLDGITLTDTEYTHSKVDWHYHENAYFTFVLEGKVLEGNKKDSYHLLAGSLLFHNWQEAHYNIKPAGFTRGFHIELSQAWPHLSYIDLFNVQGSIHLLNPEIKMLMHQIFRETKINDETSCLAINSLLINMLGKMVKATENTGKKLPPWVNQVRDILHDMPAETWTLTDLATSAGIHPVHLSRDFSKYFHCTLGEYLRKMKINRALSLLINRNLSLTEVALLCGFSDQSHFIRCFKTQLHLKPFQYRSILLK
jgi:AraC-like DNA-binding protein